MELLIQASKHEWLVSNIHAFMASALLMDAYPLEMHCKWGPRWSAFLMMADSDTAGFG
jgi:hypothetical protein